MSNNAQGESKQESEADKDYFRQARAKALIESTRSLLLLNGAAAISIAPWLNALWERQGTVSLRHGLIVGGFFFMVGAGSAAITPYARYRTGLTPKQIGGWWYVVQWLTGISITGFVVGMLFVLGAAWCANP